MEIRRPTRRSVLGTAAALTAAASAGTTLTRAFAQGATAGRQQAQIDAVLRRAIEAKEVPGIAATAATDKAVFYEGAFGTRDLAKGPEMTADTIFRLASMTRR